MIPKIIHYCWFGKNEKPDLVKHCIQSWQRFCPDYQIIEWNEDNFDVMCNQWCQEAYNLKKWAFVSDYARLYIVYKNGGIYLDTDVELKKAIPNEILQHDSFFFFMGVRSINTGYGFGSTANSELIAALLNDYENLSYIKECVVNTEINTKCMLKTLNWLKRDGTHQGKGGIEIYSDEEFRSFAEHHSMLSWNDNRAVVELCRTNSQKYRKITNLLRNPHIMQYLERNGESKLSKLYIFFAYDFWDMGPQYDEVQ